MRIRKYSTIYKKAIKKLKGKEAKNLVRKRNEILNIPNLDFYKNLKYGYKKFKRVHVNNSFVILFFGDDNTVYFVDYVSHDEAYKFDKKTLRKYQDLEFY